MKLTKTAQQLWDMGGSSKYPYPMEPEQEKLASCMGSESFGYALFEGGYINPSERVEGEDLVKLRNAIDVVTMFKDIVDHLHLEM